MTTTSSPIPARTPRRGTCQPNHGMRWLAERTRVPRKTALIWQNGDAAPIPVGLSLTAIRVPAPLGLVALRVLEEQQAQIGPVIHNRLLRAVEFLVPTRPTVGCGSDAIRMGPNRESTRFVLVPPLGSRGNGRTWLREPEAMAGRRPVLTDPFVLSRALRIARGFFPASGPVR